MLVSSTHRAGQHRRHDLVTYGNAATTRTESPARKLVRMLPLEGFRVGVSADRRAGEQVEYLHTQGATVVRAATEQTVIADPDSLREATLRLISCPPDIFVATSAVGVRSWMTHLTSWGMDEDVRTSLAHTRIFALGQETVGELAAAELEPTMKTEADPDRVAEILRWESRNVERVAVQVDGEDSTDIVRVLTDAGVTVERLATYRWQLPDDRGPAGALIRALCRGSIHAVTFTTAAAVRGAFEIAAELGLDDELRRCFRLGVVAACVGPQAADAARQNGIDDPLVPQLPRVAYLLRDLTACLGRKRKALTARGSSAIVQGELVCVDGERLVLSTRERMLFDAFADRPGQVLSKDELLKTAWPGRRNQGHLVEVTVARLRDRLGPAFGPAIVAVRRRGYRLDARAG